MSFILYYFWVLHSYRSTEYSGCTYCNWKWWTRELTDQVHALCSSDMYYLSYSIICYMCICISCLQSHTVVAVLERSSHASFLRVCNTKNSDKSELDRESQTLVVTLTTYWCLCMHHRKERPLFIRNDPDFHLDLDIRPFNLILRMVRLICTTTLQDEEGVRFGTISLGQIVFWNNWKKINKHCFNQVVRLLEQPL